MAEGDVAAEGTAPDIGVMIGQILATLGIDMEEGGATDLPTSLKSILAAVKALTSGDSEGGEDGGDGDAVAASIRAVLKLPDDVTTEGVLLAINTLKAGDGSLATMRDEITALKDRVADHDLSKFLQPYRDRGVVGVGPTDADKQLDEKIVLALSASNRDQAKHFLDERVGRLPPPGRDPGKVQDPTKGSRAGMIATAHKEWQDEGRLHVSKLDTYVNGELTENGQPQLTADEKTALSIK